MTESFSYHRVEEKSEGEAASLLEAGYTGYLDMGVRRARENDPRDIIGSALRIVATEEEIPVFDAARKIIDEKVEASLPVERNGIAPTARELTGIARSLNFFELYINNDQEAVISMAPADAKFIREGIAIEASLHEVNE